MDPLVLHVQKDRHYHHGIKITVIFTIEPGDQALPPHVRGSLERPWHWIQCLRAIGTTTNIFRDFCNYVCTDIETNNIPSTDFHQVFIWDNFYCASQCVCPQHSDGPCWSHQFLDCWVMSL